MNKIKTRRAFKYLILALLLILLLIINWYVNRPRGHDFDFVTMILNADIEMESIPQEDALTTELLEKYNPKLYVAKDSYKPVDFYETYVANSTLRKMSKKDELLQSEVSKEDLISHVNKSEYYLDFQLPYKTMLEESAIETSITPKVYGRVYRSLLKSEEEEIPLLFLKYSFAYPYSGLPEGTVWWKKAGARIIGNPMTWHELDIHGAVHIVINEETMMPVGVILAQHNNHRVHLKTFDFVWPEDDQVKIVVAKYSNEPYLVTDGEERYERVVGNPADMEFLYGMSDKEPITAGYDCVPSLEETYLVDNELVQLPLDDPLYKATMGLGDRKKILGFRTWFMDGPPGMDFYAMPALLDLSNTFAFWYIDPEDETYLNLYEEAKLSFMSMEIEALLDYQKKKMIKKIKEN